MSDVKEKKTFADESLEPVTGGTDRENRELVDLYNRFNPDQPVTKYCPKIEQWVCEVWGYPYKGTLERPIIFAHKGIELNNYLVPGMGIDHEEFLRQTEQKANIKFFGE